MEQEEMKNECPGEGQGTEGAAVVEGAACEAEASEAAACGVGLVADDAGADLEAAEPPLIAVLCVGNKLMLDDGIGPAVYQSLFRRYEFPDNVQIFDVGCLSMDMLPLVRDYDYIITVDAVDGTGAEPGTVFRFPPDAMERHSGATASLHELKLIDLFDAATLLGYKAEGICLGMQVENPSPEIVTIGLTPKVYEALPLLVETVAGELARLGSAPVEREYPAPDEDDDENL